MIIFQIFYKLFLIILITLISKVSTADNKDIVFKQNDIFIIGSNLGYDFNNIDKYVFLKDINKKYNLFNFSKQSMSIYDQMDVIDNHDFKYDDKIILVLENYFLESLLFETDYKSHFCQFNKKCHNISYIPYEKIYYPIINILHIRLLNFLSENNIIYLVDNTDFYLKLQAKDIQYKIKKKLKRDFYNNNFNNNICVLNDAMQKKIKCLNNILDY